MSNALEVIGRGIDSSGRPVKGTRQIFQHFDRVNEKVGNKLVIVQGAFRGSGGAAASAGTHNLAGCFDVRTWNLTTAERTLAMRAGRDPEIVGGAVWWYRHQGQGFDPHIHFVLLGDAPMHPDTLDQVADYKAGRNGLASNGPDDFWRPPVIKNYVYLEDDMFDAEDRQRLIRIEKGLSTFRKNELARDVAEAKRDKERFSRLITAMGQQADRLTVLINSTDDDATKAQLKEMQVEILEFLKAEPDVDGVDNPSDDAMSEL